MLNRLIEGWDYDLSEILHLKYHIYFVLAFSFTLEIRNMVMRKRMENKRVVRLNEPVLANEEKKNSGQTQ